MSRTTRSPYTGSKAIDASCRSHGGCPWCEGSKTRWRKLSQVEWLEAEFEASETFARHDAEGRAAASSDDELERVCQRQAEEVSQLTSYQIATLARAALSSGFDERARAYLGYLSDRLAFVPEKQEASEG